MKLKLFMLEWWEKNMVVHSELVESEESLTLKSYHDENFQMHLSDKRTVI